jgi:hypothetical protein
MVLKSYLIGTAAIGAAIFVTVAPSQASVISYPSGYYYENYDITSSIDIPGLVTANVYPDSTEGLTTAGLSVTAPETVVTDPFQKLGPISGTMFIGHDFDGSDVEHLVVGLNPTFGASVTGASFDSSFGTYDETDLLSALDADLTFSATDDQFNYLFGFIGQVYGQGGSFAANGGAIDVVNFSDGVQVGTGLAYLTPVTSDVPEPLTLSLFGAGLAGAAFIRRRRNAKRA